jgi:O-methyltransferase involved in polyketide biosynthesis
MTARTVQQAPSHTALGAAFYRAMAHRDATVEGIGSDHLAWTFLAGAHRLLVRFGWIRRAIRRRSGRVTLGIYEYLLARTAFFDERPDSGRWHRTDRPPGCWIRHPPLQDALT